MPVWINEAPVAERCVVQGCGGWYAQLSTDLVPRYSQLLRNRLHATWWQWHIRSIPFYGIVQCSVRLRVKQLKSKFSFTKWFYARVAYEKSDLPSARCYLLPARYSRDRWTKETFGQEATGDALEAECDPTAPSTPQHKVMFNNSIKLMGNIVCLISRRKRIN